MKAKRPSPLKSPRKTSIDKYLVTAFLENVPDLVYFKDRTSRFVAVSRSLVVRTGAENAEALIGKRDSDFYSPESAQRMRLDEQRIIADGMPSLGKLGKQIWHDGRVTWQLTSKMPLRNRRGAIIGTFGISKDVTKEREMEDALEQANCLLWHADVTGSSQAGLEWKMSLTPSALYKRIFGRQPEPGDRELWVEEMVPKWNEINKRSEKAILEGKSVYNQQFQVVIKERTFYLDEHVSITEVGPGRWNVVGIVVDITARRNAELGLIAEKERLSVTLNSMIEGAIATDSFGNVILVNKAAAEMMERPANECMGRVAAEICKFENTSSGGEIELPFKQVIEKCITAEIPPQTLLRGQTGRMRRVEGSLVPIPSRASKRVGAVLILRDVTQRHCGDELPEDNSASVMANGLERGVAN